MPFIANEGEKHNDVAPTRTAIKIIAWNITRNKSPGVHRRYFLTADCSEYTANYLINENLEVNPSGKESSTFAPVH